MFPFPSQWNKRCLIMRECWSSEVRDHERCLQFEQKKETENYRGEGAGRARRSEGAKNRQKNSVFSTTGSPF